MNALFLSLTLACNRNSDMKTFEHDGVNREYILHIPASYDGSTSVPLMFNFHGFGGTASDQMAWADMRELANEYNFILVYPQGTPLDGVSHWNSALAGGDNKSTADDFGFILALIENLSSTYSIDADRIYASGYSNGGFMSYSLVCYHSDIFAGIGAVSSTMLNDFKGDCNPTRPVPIISLNGTSDSVVPYEGGAAGYQAIPDVVDYWVNHNNIATEPTTNSVDNSGTTIERTYYEDGDNGVSVDHYKVFNGEHVWFDLNYEGSDTNQLIWNFLSQYDLNGLRE